MPTETTLYYHFGGAYTQDLYSEEEMAAAVNLTVDELRRALDEDYGPCPYPDRRVYSHHIHPRANGGFEKGKFLFNRAAYQTNLQRYNFVRWMKESGLWTNPEACQSYMYEVFDQYKDGGDAQVFKAGLAAFVTAWERGDTSYHERIANHYRHIATARLIWLRSGYLDGMSITANLFSCVFTGPDEPTEGTAIDWQWLRLHPDYGFYDQRNLPDVQGVFMPETNPTDWQPYVMGETKLQPGDLVAGERFVYDDYYVFAGIVIRVTSDEVNISDNGRYLLNYDYRDIHTYIQRG